MKHRLLSVLTLLASLPAGLSAATSVPAQVATAADAADGAESAKANAFFERAFGEMLARSPQFMARLGLKQDNDKWDDLSEQHALEDLVIRTGQLAELKRTINFEALDDQARVSYRMFVEDVERAIEGWRWRHHNYPVNQMDGLHSEAPAFLINYHPIENAADARAYIVWPGQATGYKIGMLKIIELRERAKKQLGATFDLREFHDQVLKDGAVPLNILEENVQAWIAKKKG